MKKCPQCEMTVADPCECPVCKTNLVDEEYFEGKGEIYKLNKFFLPFFIKRCWFFICCCALILLKTLFFGIDFNISILLTPLLLFITLMESLFPERLKNLAKWKYSDNYLDFAFASSFELYFCGIFALASSFLW